MILKHNDLHIPEKEGSDPFENCKLQRKQYGNILTQIVSNYADGFVLAINNPWGEGKTTFVKMWKQHLKNEGYTTLYYNAWENDFEKDVLVALISELGEIENKSKKTFNKVLDKVVPLTSKLLPLIAKHLIKKTIGDEATEALAEGVAEYGADQLKEEINIYTSKKKSIEDFKTTLEQFVSEVSNDKPIVFIIDELDRCRPNYAVEVLEQVKHLFSVSGIVFALSIDKVQLGHAVRGVYGSDNINADEYLRRFIDIEYSLPKPDMNLLCNYFYNYFGFKQYFENESRNREFRDDGEEFKSLSIYLFERLNLSIRQIEKIYAHSRLVLTSIPYNNGVFTKLHLLLIYLKNIHPEIYKGISNKSFEVQNLIDKVENHIPYIKSGNFNVNAILFTIVKLAIMYHNYYYENTYPQTHIVEKDEKDVEYFIYKSKFDNLEPRLDLLGAYKSVTNKYYFHRFKIDSITKKLDLLDPIVI